MSTRRAGWLVAGIIALGAALALTLAPVTVHGVDCGTILASRTFEPTDGTNGEYVTTSTCADPITDRRWYAAIATLAGAIITAGAISGAAWTERPPHEILLPGKRIDPEANPPST